MSSREDRVAGRRLWDIGDWGEASRYLGQRWEALGADLLAERMNATHGPHVRITYLTGVEAQEAIGRTGLKNPDAVLIAVEGGTERLRAVDFKWSLETAEYVQICGETLRALHEALGLAALLGGSQPAPAFGDGFFVSPELHINQTFLDSAANRRQEYPLEEDEVLLVAVESEVFFGPLPGWEHARFLADVDRAVRSLARLDDGERYYRLGTGLAGALAKLPAPIFDTEPPEPASLDDLVQLRAAIDARTSADLIRHVGRQMDQRQALVRRLRTLTRTPYRFGDLTRDLATLGIEVGDPATNGKGLPEVRERWQPILRAVAELHREAVRLEGRALVQSGRTEASALASLEKQAPELMRSTRGAARQMVEKALETS